MRKAICGIYKITSPTRCIYIGQSIDCIRRKWVYAGARCSDQFRIYNSIKKHGWNKHKFEIIHICEREDLNKMEEYYINLFQSYNSKYGMNLSMAATRGSVSEETRRRVSIALTGKKKSPEHVAKMRALVRSEEHKRNISLSKKGKKGVPHTEEWKIKMRNINLGRKHTQETRDKMLGRITTQETRDKISIANKGKIRTEEMVAKLLGRPAWNKGKKFSAETRLKMSISAKKKVITEEHRRKMNLGRVGCKRIPAPDDVKKKISDGVKRYYSKKRESS